MCNVTKIEFNEKQNEAINRFVDRFSDLFIEVMVPYFDSGDIDPEWILDENVYAEIMNRYATTLDERLSKRYEEIES